MYKLQLGDYKKEYELFKTNAIQRYDGFGTLSLYDGGVEKSKDKSRYVLIELEHIDWQIGRYMSGLYRVDKTDEIPNSEITRKFFELIKKTLTESC